LAISLRIVAVGLLAAVTAAPLAAEAQAARDGERPGQSRGLRYLTWSGKAPDPARTPRPAPAAAAAETPPSPAPRQRIYGPPAAGPRANTLTPASAWLPTGQTEAAQPEAVPAPASPGAPEPLPAPAVPADRPADAPRADAPIFRLAARPAAAGPTPPAAQPGPDAAPAASRYYSVHRAAGRAPDPVALPEPVMLDQPPVDLAVPDGPPVVLRDARGRLVPAEVLDGSTLP
jgi:hypothetical protein